MAIIQKIKINSKATLLQQIQSEPQNCLYAFLGEANARKLNSTIQWKREQQLKWLGMYGTQYKATSQEIIAALNTGCKNIYGYDCITAMNRIYAGKTLIVKKSAVSGIAGPAGSEIMPGDIDPEFGLPVSVISGVRCGRIGVTTTSDGTLDYDADGTLAAQGLTTSALDKLKTNTKNGVPTNLTTSDGTKYSTTVNQLNGLVTLFNTTDGQYVSYFDQITGFWQKADGTFLNKNNATSWDWVCAAICTLVGLLKIISSMLNIKQPEEFSCMQTDGWYTPFDEQQASTLKKGNTAAIIVGIVILALFIKRK